MCTTLHCTINCLLQPSINLYNAPLHYKLSVPALNQSVQRSTALQTVCSSPQSICTTLHCTINMLLPYGDSFCCLLNIKPTNQPLYQFNTSNDSTNTKLQKYKQQSLQVQISDLLQLLILSNHENKHNKKSFLMIT